MCTTQRGVYTVQPGLPMVSLRGNGQKNADLHQHRAWPRALFCSVCRVLAIAWNSPFGGRTQSPRKRPPQQLQTIGTPPCLLTGLKESGESFPGGKQTAPQIGLNFGPKPNPPLAERLAPSPKVSMFVYC